MNAKMTGIRKAAILLASLDQAAAEKVLRQMAPHQAQQARQEMVNLGQVDPEERQRVIEEFFRIGPMVPEKNAPGIELDDSLARKLSLVEASSSGDAGMASEPAGTAPFRFLREAEADKLARTLVGERPQTIAVVLSHLSPEQAGSVLVRLAAPLQVEVIRRLVDLDEMDPEILREVELALESRLSEHVRIERRRVAGLSAMAGILEGSSPSTAEQIFDNIAAHDHQLAERLGPRRPDFDELRWLDDAALETVLAAADLELLALALVGAPPEMSARFLRRLPESKARHVRHELNDFGPVRLDDVEEARRRIAALAQRMAVQRQIALPSRVGMGTTGSERLLGAA